MLMNLFVKHKLVASLLLLTALAYGVPAVYAHCGKCIVDAKHFAGALDESKMTLAAASTAARRRAWCRPRQSDSCLSPTENERPRSRGSARRSGHSPRELPFARA